MSTPRLPTYIKSQSERRERGMQTAFPAKVISWSSTTNTVELEPQFIETWVNRDGTREQEPTEYPYIDNVPVLFPRSGSWSITFPIETGSYGLVICTKFSLDLWRQRGSATDPGDLRRFGMSGAVFHPVNLYPDSGALSSVDSSYMILSDGGTVDFVALKKDVDDIKVMLDEIKADYNSHVHTSSCTAGGSPTATTATQVAASYTVTASSKVKVQ